MYKDRQEKKDINYGVAFLDELALLTCFGIGLGEMKAFRNLRVPQTVLHVLENIYSCAFLTKCLPVCLAFLFTNHKLCFHVAHTA